MSKPTTKTQLLEEIEREHAALEEFISALPPEDRTRPGVLGPWSVKDVMAHLFEWEQMFLGWYKAGLQGKVMVLPTPGFTWGQLDALNQHLFEKHCGQSFAVVQRRFRASYRQLIKTVRALPEEEIFKSGCHAWTEKHPLLSFIYPNTSSHYRWARRELQKGLRRKRTA